MAQRVEVVLVDDLDGGPADETVQFGLDGVTYEIDLNEENAAALRDAVAVYVGHSRRVSGRRSSSKASPGRARRSGSSETAQIRAWAKEQGLAVNERGRVPADIVAQYEAAHA
jgi:hypothetical protein